ncbi:SEC14 cytosolic factor-like [Zingiber officinale]|uniref:CRAL-TRIO domain-containing protein n=1 Tax=Zingiber officinale TaxID=94328 RepID=A0A8J5ECX1_ZINOF|nr:SEC14 cytosolic factor-like [Zingiber officinale]KAG6472177.1 hypothetical protein ZIOFF_069634 [Zingiber officinale]
MEVEDKLALPGSDPVEKRKVASLRALVEAENPDAKEVDNMALRRFLRARDLDVEKASAQFLKHLKWRKTMTPNGFISESEISNELAHKELYKQGFDKQGRPIIVYLVANHVSAGRQMDELKRFAVYALEKACASMPNGQEKFIIISDLQGWGYSSCDVRGYLSAIDILQSYYPERLGKAFLINVPYIFMKVWKVIYQFLDAKTKEKFIFVANKEMRDTLLADIDESQLPEKYGGRLSLVPIEESI